MKPDFLMQVILYWVYWRAIHGTHYKCLPVWKTKPLVTYFSYGYIATPASETSINLADYKDILLQRFANPNIKDSVGRICSEKLQTT
jgi:hypothetical protein